LTSRDRQKMVAAIKAEEAQERQPPFIDTARDRFKDEFDPSEQLIALVLADLERAWGDASAHIPASAKRQMAINVLRMRTPDDLAGIYGVTTQGAVPAEGSPNRMTADVGATLKGEGVGMFDSALHRNADRFFNAREQRQKTEGERRKQELMDPAYWARMA